ncbi:CGNR zinc finger domain-containing protein [Alkalihalobacillus trypoxylicola]|uniref:Zinc finger CGNR domain-containing protein n=1 Tax=Alkalihalobacillus trypoxylicola TaxID=519424 RepID=A0A162DT82_9BACI|nr:CGNR zinc finger domain-containing protein [Alkalihalobacillus trypoxylicola]KYG30771.1 hypothetical protein AZF04_18975 [Alkalihalobacillus trypoxylicola]
MSENTIFPVISKHLSLNLVNTEIVKRGIRHDLLKGSFGDWIKNMNHSENIVNEQFNFEDVVAGELDTLFHLREFLRDGFETMIERGNLNEQWSSYLEQLIEKAPLSYKLISGSLVPIPVGSSSDAIVSLIAFDALQLYTSGELHTLRRCANPDCVLLFLDTSGRRKWCSMKICGNRMKVSRHNKQK